MEKTSKQKGARRQTPATQDCPSKMSLLNSQQFKKNNTDIKVIVIAVKKGKMKVIILNYTAIKQKSVERLNGTAKTCAIKIQVISATEDDHKT